MAQKADRPQSVARPDFTGISEARRRNMAAIRGKDTQPEMQVRRMVHGMGYRYRLHVKDLPGRPDMVFPGRRRIIEIRGCFWHRHPGCIHAALPRTRVDFWTAKFEATVGRDTRNVAALEAEGWAVMVIWECETQDAGLSDRIQAFLEGRSVAPAPTAPADRGSASW